MKAVQLTSLQEPLDLRAVPTPVPLENEVLVKVSAAGICHSDAHYRAGTSSVKTLPITLGHEVAGRIAAVGNNVDQGLMGRRVCLHYLVTCGTCIHCSSGNEQFCPRVEMIGKHRDGGYAEYIRIPSRNAVMIPDNVSDEQAAIMMCSSATAYHALRKGRLLRGESVAVVGCGGLGMSAIRIAQLMGASKVFAIDVDPSKLDKTISLNAMPVDAKDRPNAAIDEATGGAGVDVAVEFVGTAQTIELALSILGPKGRAAIAGIGNQPIQVNAYTQLIGKEAELIGVSDHTLLELRDILDWASKDQLDLSGVVEESVPLDAQAINGVLDRLENGTAPARTVIRTDG